MTFDDYGTVEGLVAESAKALGIKRPPALFVPGASCVEIDMSEKYGRASDVSRLRRTLSALLAAKGLSLVVTRTSPRRLSVSDEKLRRWKVKKILKSAWEWVCLVGIALYACIFIREGDEKDS